MNSNKSTLLGCCDVFYYKKLLMNVSLSLEIKYSHKVIIHNHNMIESTNGGLDCSAKRVGSAPPQSKQNEKSK